MNPIQTVNPNNQPVAGMGLPATTAPGNAGNIVQSPQITIPSATTTAPDISIAAATLAGSQTGTQISQDQINKQIQANADAQTAALKNQSTNNQSFLSTLFGNQTSRQDATTQEETKLGIDPQAYLTQKSTLESSVNSLNKSYTDAKNAMQAELDKANDNLSTTGSINAAQAAIQRNYAPQLNQLASQINFSTAQLSTLNGDFATAQGLVDKYVSNVTADQQTKVNQALTLKQDNDTTFTNLDKVYQDAFNSYIKTEQDKLTQQTNDAKQVGTLSITYPKAGILPTDTLAQAQAKVVASGGNTSGTTETINGKVMNVIRDSQGNIVRQTTLGTAPQNPMQKLSDTQTMQSNLQYLADQNGGYIKPEDWNKQLSAWVSEYPGKASEFESDFKQYTDPKVDYGRTITAPKTQSTVSKVLGFFKGLLP